VNRSDRPGVELLAVEEAEIVGMGGDLTAYRWARDAGASHGECVEIARLDGDLYVYQEARDAGASHGECVEIARLRGDLDGYREARRNGCTHATIVEAVTVHGLPAELLTRYIDRMRRAPDADPATVVFETVVGVPYG
jgi:hypothetical protein